MAMNHHTTNLSESDSWYSLDQLSTLQNFQGKRGKKASFDIHNESDELIAIAIENHEELADTVCANHAPFIAYQVDSGAWYLAQGCCNSWQCPRCSTIRAKHEYGNIVHGAKTLAIEHKLWLVTLTMRGKELNLDTADDEYYTLTNRLFAAWRAETKRHLGHWCYVQVTERQKRGAAHSHVICTMAPQDIKPYSAGQKLPSGAIAKRDCYFSTWLMKRAESAGLGRMIDISLVDNPHGVGSYVAKYLFKDIQTHIWPRHWKRIRYSRNWPKVQHESSASAAFPVIRAPDWNRVRELPLVRAVDNTSYEKALAALCLNVIPPA